MGDESVFVKVGLLVSAISTLLSLIALVWVIVVYRRDRKRELIAQLDQDMVLAKEELSNLRFGYDHHVIKVSDKMFNPSDIDSGRVLQLINTALARDSVKEAETFMQLHSSEVYESIAYALAQLTHDVVMARHQFTTRIAPLTRSSPVLHKFFVSAGEVILRLYLRTVHLDTIVKHIDQVVSLQWATPDTKPTDDAVYTTLRGIFRTQLMHYRQMDNKVFEIMDLVHTAVTEFSRAYREAGLTKQWRGYKRDSKASIGEFDAAKTSTETLLLIANWKLRGRRFESAHKDCKKALDELELRVKSDEREAAA